jgi:hypothetical protein
VDLRLAAASVGLLVGPALPPLADVLAMVPDPFDRVVYGFCPDLLDPDAVLEPVLTGAFQVRGRWPDGPIAIPPCWEH